MNICPGSANPPRQPVCSNGPVKYAVDRAHFTRANNSRRSAAPHSAAQVRDDPGGSSFPSPRCGTSLTKSHLTRTQKPRNVVLWNLWSREVEYEEAWRFQKFEANEYAIDPDNQADRLLLLQHPPVYTLGTGSTEDNLKFDISDPILPTFRTERGGEVTYHGPGQLVMYPILNLRNHQQDLHWFLRQLEEVVILALDEVSGLKGERIEGLTGVWVSGCKVAAIGVRATRWITYHGLALNVVNDLDPFSDIVPCGISDRSVGSVMSCLVSDEMEGEDGFSDADKTALLEEYGHALVECFCRVFDVSPVEAMSDSSDTGRETP